MVNHDFFFVNKEKLEILMERAGIGHDYAELARRCGKGHVTFFDSVTKASSRGPYTTSLATIAIDGLKIPLIDFIQETFPYYFEDHYINIEKEFKIEKSETPNVPESATWVEEKIIKAIWNRPNLSSKLIDHWNEFRFKEIPIKIWKGILSFLNLLRRIVQVIGLLVLGGIIISSLVIVLQNPRDYFQLKYELSEIESRMQEQIDAKQDSLVVLKQE